MTEMRVWMLGAVLLCGCELATEEPAAAPARTARIEVAAPVQALPMPRRQARTVTPETLAWEHAQHAAENLETDCASDRAARIARLQDRSDWYERRGKLVEWMNAHCVLEDTGKDVVAELEVEGGFFVKKRIHAGGVERKCHGKPPEKLPDNILNDYADALYLSPSDQHRNLMCDETDVAHGAQHPAGP